MNMVAYIISLLEVTVVVPRLSSNQTKVCLSPLPPCKIPDVHNEISNLRYFVFRVPLDNNFSTYLSVEYFCNLKKLPLQKANLFAATPKFEARLPVPLFAESHNEYAKRQVPRGCLQTLHRSDLDFLQNRNAMASILKRIA